MVSSRQLFLATLSLTGHCLLANATYITTETYDNTVTTCPEDSPTPSPTTYPVTTERSSSDASSIPSHYPTSGQVTTEPSSCLPSTVTSILTLPPTTATCTASTTTLTVTAQPSFCNATISVSTTTVTSNVTRTQEVTKTETKTESWSCVPTPDIPALKCDRFGYLIQRATLYRVDLATGKDTVVKQTVGDGSNINALGYNSLDNFLYGRQEGKNQLIRIASNGKSEVVGKMPTDASAYLGDIDGEGYYWYAVGGHHWFKVDLRPGSPTYAKLVDSGALGKPAGTVADWVYIPNGGEYLYSIATGVRGGTNLVRFNMQKPAWEVVAHYGLALDQVGALYGMNDSPGTIFGSENSSGHIYSFPIDGSKPKKVSNGPPSHYNDGARCVNNVVSV